MYRVTTATARFYVQEQIRDQDGNSFRVAGVYQDELCQEAGALEVCGAALQCHVPRAAGLQRGMERLSAPMIPASARCYCTLMTFTSPDSLPALM